MAGKNEIRTWLEKGKEEGATHVVVVCDTFDYDDYPVTVTKEEKIEEVIKRYDGLNHQRIMEIYNLSLDIEMQLNSKRAYYL